MQQRELEISDLFFALWRRSLWLLVLAVLGGALGYWWAGRTPPIYQATAFIELGRIDQEVVEEPHLLAEVINSPAFLVAKSETESEETGAEPVEGGKKKKKRRAGGGGRVTAECLETGRKRERIVYLIRLSADSEDKAGARTTIETAANAVIERTKKPYDDAVRLFKDREVELTARLETLKKNPGASLQEISLCERELFEVHSKMLSQRTYPTRLALEITAPEVISAPQPKRNALIAGMAALLLGSLVVVAYEFLRLASPSSTTATTNETKESENH